MRTSGGNPPGELEEADDPEFLIPGPDPGLRCYFPRTRMVKFLYSAYPCYSDDSLSFEGDRDPDDKGESRRGRFLS